MITCLFKHGNLIRLKGLSHEMDFSAFDGLNKLTIVTCHQKPNSSRETVSI